MVSSQEAVRDSITRFWDSVAPHYEGRAGNTAEVGTAEYESWMNVYRRLLPPQPSEILDLCTGTGFVAIICAKLGHRVTAVDLAPSMLAIARKMAKEAGLSIKFVEADAVSPQFSANTFDVLTHRHSLWTQRDPQTALTNWRRILRPGGRLIAVDAFHSWNFSSAESEHEKYFLSFYTPDVRSALPFMQIQDQSPLIGALDRVGFRDVHFELLPTDLSAAPDFREFAVVAYP